jgi:hypothetical protein
MKVDISKGFDIGGLHFEIKSDGLRMESENRYGEYCGLLQTVTLRKELKPDNISSSFLHEIVECINYQYNLSLTHPTICAFELGLAQILKSLDIEFAIEEK